MRKTFEDLIKDYYKNNYSPDQGGGGISLEMCVALTQIVREKTLEECVDHAEADYDGNIIKESILELDKNSIEI